MGRRRADPRHDGAARQFLAAAPRLIDAYVDDQTRAGRPARLRSIRFPAALDWLRTEDVIRLAATAGKAGASRKAFFNRWPTREEFLPDALVYALVYDEVPEDPKELATQMPADAAAASPFSEGGIRISDYLLDSLRRHPRSYLTLHIGPLLPQHPQLWQALIPARQPGIQVWPDADAALLTDLGRGHLPRWAPRRPAPH